jgi:predicted nucleic acid-binding Zn ribbon protein
VRTVYATTTDDKTPMRLILPDGTPLFWLECRTCGCQTTTVEAPGDDGMVQCVGCWAEELYGKAFEEVGDE